MIRTVLDTNVLVSGAMASRGAVATIIAAWNRRQFQVVISEWIFLELVRTLNNDYFTSRLTEADILEYLAFIRSRAQFVVLAGGAVPRTASHPEDDYILETAVQSAVDYLVAGDHMLNQLRCYRGITIVTPREFLDVLETQNS